MIDPAAPATQAAIRFERRYQDAAVQDLWDLWTTKEGFESWWGPKGFRVEVRKLELREGGRLLYDMIAAAPEEIAAMKRLNMPISQTTGATFGRIEPLKHLELVHLIDFVPGVKPYENRIRVEFSNADSSAQMVIMVEPHQSPEWTRMATMGMESQLTKVPALLAARR
ncbi:MAG TPA: SRPBCC domain-containing protein [Steroidobacteraceae bacterium]|jgi:uncharacterized protein YndB with AHSA1/START domain